jgi:uncharacterized protein HemY
MDDAKKEVLLGQTSLLLASWDTMGWILYREGKFGEAESWLEAARLGRPDAEVLGHMAKEREALGAFGEQGGKGKGGRRRPPLLVV